LFNKFLYSVFTTSHINTPNDDDVIDTFATNYIISISISQDEVCRALVTLDHSKATGIDGIGLKILKYCAPALFKPLHYLYTHLSYINTLFHLNGMFIVSYLFSNQEIELLLQTIDLYRYYVMHRRYSNNNIIDHISKIISPLQFEFLKHRSIVQHLLLLFDNIVCTNHQTEALYLDFCKSFDSVPHNELQKLKTVGISGNLWLFFKFYLLNRQQCVKINNHFTDLLPILSGIPQGSILEPILFLIYINDLPEQVQHSILLLFADDTKCFKSIYDLSDYLHLQAGPNSLYGWSIRSNLLFSLGKIIFMSFKSTIPILYTIGN